MGEVIGDEVSGGGIGGGYGGRGLKLLINNKANRNSKSIIDIENSVSEF